MYRIVYPDYDNSILNVTASILKHYGVPTDVPTNRTLDEELKKGYRNVVYVLVDALGSEILKQHSKTAPELYKDLVEEVTSVFPSTTTSATTSVLTGLPPVKTGWLGWCQYVKEVDKSVIFFKNSDYYNDKVTFQENLSTKIVPVRQIYEQIEEADPSVKTLEIFPAFREPNHDTFLKQCQTVFSSCQEPGRHFIYVYWDQVDTIMHDKGPGSREASHTIKLVEDGYIYLKENMSEDTIVVLIADHGQVGVCPIELRRYPDLWETFLHEPSIESRAASFFIKPDSIDLFKKRFNEHFRDYFILLDKKEVDDLELFGPGMKHDRFDDFIGEFLAIAIDHYYFKMSEGPYFMRGQHAGLLEEEMMVPLIIHSKK